jgi:hypothetical protein
VKEREKHTKVALFPLFSRQVPKKPMDEHFVLKDGIEFRLIFGFRCWKTTGKTGL